MGDAGYLVGLFVEILSKCFLSLGSTPILGEYTILDIAITMVVLSLILGAVFRMMGHDDPTQQKHYDAHPPEWGVGSRRRRRY